MREAVSKKNRRSFHAGFPRRSGALSPDHGRSRRGSPQIWQRSIPLRNWIDRRRDRRLSRAPDVRGQAPTERLGVETRGCAQTGRSERAHGFVAKGEVDEVPAHRAAKEIFPVPRLWQGSRSPDRSFAGQSRRLSAAARGPRAAAPVRSAFALSKGTSGSRQTPSCRSRLVVGRRRTAREAR